MFQSIPEVQDVKMEETMIDTSDYMTLVDENT